MRQVPGEAAAPVTRLAELPGRGVTRVWQCAGPPGAGTLMLIHGVTFTAALNWGKVFAPLAAHFRVIAADLRGHGDGIRAGSRFRLEDCADDVAALAGALGIGRFVAVGYSMSGMIAQLVYRRHAQLLSGLVLCSTAGNAAGSPVGKLAAFALPTAAAGLRWNPVLQPVSAEGLGLVLLALDALTGAAAADTGGEAGGDDLPDHEAAAQALLKAVKLQAAAFRKLDAAAVLAGPLLPAPREIASADSAGPAAGPVRGLLPGSAGARRRPGGSRPAGG